MPFFYKFSINRTIATLVEVSERDFSELTTRDLYININFRFRY